MDDSKLKLKNKIPLEKDGNTNSSLQNLTE